MNKNKSLKIKILYFLIIIFILKNVLTFSINYTEIKKLENDLSIHKETNLQLIDDIKNIKTDGFVIRYAVDNLNLRPKEEDLTDLTITDEELMEIEIRLAAKKFGKKFENIPIEEIEISDELKEKLLKQIEEKEQKEKELEKELENKAENIVENNE